MEPNIEEREFDAQLRERFLKLPKPVRDAITSTDIAKKLQEISEGQKLHIDQWEKLENEVMLTLLGAQPAEKLEENIKNEVVVTQEIASALTASIAEKIFEPIRKELERELEETAKSKEKIEQIPEPVTETPAPVIENPAPTPTSVVIAPTPSTPPTAISTEKSVRAPISESYASQAKSHERASIEGDPYREPVV